MTTLIKSTFQFSLATAKKVATLVAPITPKIVKDTVEKAVALSEKMYKMPYETTKEIVPARIFNNGEKIWVSYGQPAVIKTQDVVLLTRTWVDKKVADIFALISNTETFVKAKVHSSITFASSIVQESHSYTVARSEIAYNKAFSLVRSFSGLKQA